MKIFTYSALALIFSLSACSSQKKLVDNPPFDLGQATCQSWTGGRPESGSGILLEIPLMGENIDGMKMQQAFFRGMMTDVSIATKDGKQMAKANFRKPSPEDMDLTMHADPKEEVGNKPPKKKGKFPFELTQDECVLSYMDGETIKYFKIENVKEKKPLIYK